MYITMCPIVYICKSLFATSYTYVHHHVPHRIHMYITLYTLQFSVDAHCSNKKKKNPSSIHLHDFTRYSQQTEILNRYEFLKDRNSHRTWHYFPFLRTSNQKKNKNSQKNHGSQSVVWCSSSPEHQYRYDPWKHFIADRWNSQRTKFSKDRNSPKKSWFSKFRDMFFLSRTSNLYRYDPW